MGISIDRRVFRRLTDHDESWSETVVVECEPDAAVVEALEAVAARAMRVGRGGREYTDADLEQLGDRIETPNAAMVSVRPDGRHQLYVDCKRVLGKGRSSSLRAALKEEFEARGIAAARLVPSPEEVADAEQWDLDHPEVVEQLEPPGWVQFKDGTPPGFPNALQPNAVAIWERRAAMYWERHPSGPPTSNEGWAASVSWLDPNGFQAAVWSTYTELLAAGCVGRHEPFHVEGFGFRAAFAALRFAGLDVTLRGIRLPGARGKPKRLRNRPEESWLWVAVLQPREPGEASIETLLRQYELWPAASAP